MYAGVDVHRGFCQTTMMDDQGASVECGRPGVKAPVVLESPFGRERRSPSSPDPKA